ncbi:MAG: PAS domain-containing protein [Alphaproteobacteria bacterium]|nr:PAS domain-containing protein [Alphaproteobacteria bacterium]
MTPLHRLEELLLNLFNVDELWRWVRQRWPDQGLDRLISSDLSPALRTHELVEALKRRGLIDAAFFLHLVAARPRRKEAIREVERCWMEQGAANPFRALVPEDPQSGLLLDAFVDTENASYLYYVHTMDGTLTWISEGWSHDALVKHYQQRMATGELNIRDMLVDPTMADHLIRHMLEKDVHRAEEAVLSHVEAVRGGASRPRAYLNLSPRVQPNYAYIRLVDGRVERKLRVAFKPQVIAALVGLGDITDVAGGSLHHRVEVDGTVWEIRVQGQMWVPFQSSFADIFAFSDEPIVIFDPRGNITRANRAATRLLGPAHRCTPHDLRGLPIWDFLPPDTCALLRRRLEATSRQLLRFRRLLNARGASAACLAENLDRLKLHHDTYHVPLRCVERSRRGALRPVYRFHQVKIGFAIIDPDTYHPLRFVARIHLPTAVEAHQRVAAMGEPAWHMLLESHRSLRHAMDRRGGYRTLLDAHTGRLLPRADSEGEVLMDLRIPRTRSVVLLLANLSRSYEIVHLLNQKGEIGDRILRRFVMRLREGVSKAIQRHHGFIVRFSGDTVLAVFGLQEDLLRYTLTERPPERHPTLSPAQQKQVREATLHAHETLPDAEARERAVASPHVQGLRAAVGIRDAYVALRDDYNACLARNMPLEPTRREAGLRVALHQGLVVAGDMGPRAIRADREMPADLRWIVPSNQSFEVLGEAVSLLYRVVDKTDADNMIRIRFTEPFRAVLQKEASNEFAVGHTSESVRLTDLGHYPIWDLVGPPDRR